MISQRLCFKETLNNERGMALVIALVLLCVLTIIGVAAINTSTVEILISGAEKETGEAFYAADGGIQYALQQVATVVDPAGSYNLTDTNVTISFARETDLSQTQRAGTSISFGAKPLKKYQKVYTITSASTTRGSKTIEAEATAEVWEPR
ncbi:MAG: pilus assembly PilX N-terminal domain-containing protein [Deltaproteobacteria bacterium]|nr:pilus assembly PilX N-terminal domain-containing protein [Deltaproteobacteria bacterium]RLB81354.1 MAG: hypothetical protein DRH17_09410 [Deltaproteobacteria bacterium]